ncbi:endonuclease/exonuclease/phosphatase family protein [Bradyrhizobium lablabi]|uniref:endonuclease/exonuclease/phosphatase family protein n=1 Tax=Bradyrhizobium lablabi TaxID=722472 RepID=UPI001BA5F5EB|nr:endonuclease/exonuclease/phosphatase family protein [Bradyrhizobium lablabi]MBR0697334.1 endonuclease/exonuclease/phosphatase family protein [Bradyrhizobium lablabi]
MDYTPLRRAEKTEVLRITSGLKDLRAGLSNKIPTKGAGRLLLATWNIREFGGTKYGERMQDARFFIAECINHFDLVAVQEVRRNLDELRRVMRLLGPHWDVIFTDVSYAQGGNAERLAFLFDKNQVSFTGLAGEIVLPPKESKIVAQIARTPFICGFQAGWAKFNLCTVHIYYGKGDEDRRRVGEIEATAGVLAKKAKDYINTDKRVSYSPENLVLLGDFNIAKHSDKTFQELVKSGFVIPDQLQKVPGSNVTKDKFYDQIAFFKRTEGLINRQAGVFDFYDYVYNDEKRYAKPFKATNARSFKEWRTYQMSDHLIMWSQFDVDKTDTYLDDVANSHDADNAEQKAGGTRTAKKKSGKAAKKAPKKAAKSSARKAPAKKAARKRRG